MGVGTTIVAIVAMLCATLIILYGMGKRRK